MSVPSFGSVQAAARRRGLWFHRLGGRAKWAVLHQKNGVPLRFESLAEAERYVFAYPVQKNYRPY